MSNLFEQLISGSSQKSPQPELLEALGKKAAAQYLQDETSLNQTIVKLASEYGSLNNEHIKRIAEFANNAVFQGLHSRNEDKNVHFPIANPSAIIQDLRDGGSPLHDGKTVGSTSTGNKTSGVPVNNNMDYLLPPGSVPRSIPNTDGFADQASGMAELDRRNQTSGVMGTGEAIAKEASSNMAWDLIHSNPVDDIFNHHLRLRAAKEKLAESHETFDLALKSSKEEFYQEVKHLVLDADGPGLMAVVNAVKLASPNDSFAFQVLRPVAERLVKEGAIKKGPLQKVASQKIVNMRHPIMITYSSLMKLAEEKVRSQEALFEIDKSIEQTSSFLRKNLQ